MIPYTAHKRPSFNPHSTLIQPSFNPHSTLAQMIPHTAHKRRDRQLVRRLAAAENLQVKHALMERKAVYCTVTGDSRCGVCNKRITDRVFALTPGAELVHYSCLDGKAKFDAK